MARPSSVVMTIGREVLPPPPEPAPKKPTPANELAMTKAMIRELREKIVEFNRRIKECEVEIRKHERRVTKLEAAKSK